MAASTRIRSRRRIVVIVVTLAVIGAAAWWWHRHQPDAAAQYRTAAVDRGDIQVAISATGTLSAISTVDVGSQISGQVIQVLVDFNDHVKKGEVLARIDPSTYQAQISQGTAATASARASLASAQATLRNAQEDYTRKVALVQQQLVARSDADLAKAVLDQGRAQVDVAQAQIAQQTATTQASRLNLERTVIRSPVDGVVLTRTVEPGQTVAASLQAPVLFQIAEDLSQMQIVLAIDEADIGQVAPGQAVAFDVDAFPNRQYRGKVLQVRLSATNTSNVITYPVVVLVDNSDQSLLPGMTANAEIEVSHRDQVLRVPNAALRYKPDDDEISTQAATPRTSGMVEALSQTAQQLQLNSTQQTEFDQALGKLRERAAARQAPAAAQTGGSPLLGSRGGGPRSGGNGAEDQAATGQRMLQRLQQQFSGFRNGLDASRQQRWDAALLALASARRVPVYKLVDGKPQQVMVEVGASDGSNTEVSGDVREGETVIVGAARVQAG